MIYYQRSLDSIGVEQLTGFFQGWHHPEKPEHHLKILQNCDAFILAIDEETGQVIGSITILTDHVQAVYISLLEVLPEYQGQGIGSYLLTQILEQFKQIPGIDLMCALSVQPFYERLGMQRSVGMVKRNYPKP